MFDDTLIGDLVTAGLSPELINRVHRLVVENERHAASRDRLAERRQKDRDRKEKQRKNKAKAEGRRITKRAKNVSAEVTGHHVTFDDFWNVYPKRGDAANPKKPARELFERHVKAGVSPDLMIAAARRYAEIERKAGRYGTDKVAQAKTWLSVRERRWEDYPELAPVVEKPVWAEPPREYLERKAKHVNGKSHHQAELFGDGTGVVLPEVPGTPRPAPDHHKRDA